MKKTLILLTGLSYGLYAHTLWIDDQFSMHEGHMQQEHLTETKDKIKKSKIKNLFCLHHNMSKKVSYAALPTLECDAIFIQLHPSYYTKTPYGTKNISKEKAKMPIESWLSIESVKRVYSNAAKKPIGKGLEIVFRNEPSKIGVGDKARVRIYFNGTPLAKARIANGHKTIGLSDTNGDVNVKIRNKGLQNIKASYSQPSDGVKCDKIIHSTTVNFEVKK